MDISGEQEEVFVVFKFKLASGGADAALGAQFKQVVDQLLELTKGMVPGAAEILEAFPIQHDAKVDGDSLYFKVCGSQSLAAFIASRPEVQMAQAVFSQLPGCQKFDVDFKFNTNFQEVTSSDEKIVVPFLKGVKVNANLELARAVLNLIIQLAQSEDPFSQLLPLIFTCAQLNLKVKSPLECPEIKAMIEGCCGGTMPTGKSQFEETKGEMAMLDFLPPPFKVLVKIIQDNFAPDVCVAKVYKPLNLSVGVHVQLPGFGGFPAV